MIWTATTKDISRTLFSKMFDPSAPGNTCIPKQFQRPLMTYRAPSQAGRGTGRCWGWPPPRGAWGCPPLWAFGKWAVWWRWDSTAGPPGEPSSPSGSWSIPWRETKVKNVKMWKMSSDLPLLSYKHTAVTWGTGWSRQTLPSCPVWPLGLLKCDWK